jgi:glycerophosphoryl diester phosphodiesterase
MTDRPIVIAHRGASGYLPEHTLPAKALAYGLGADFLEQDVVATRDRQLVVLHDIFLDDVTNVAQRFPGRNRNDGRHYVVDFDLAEIETLAVCERRAPASGAARFPSRFPTGTVIAGVATLATELKLIRGLNKSMRRTVGIYPEIKDPQWHRQHGIDLAALLLAELAAFGYEAAGDPAFVQCFDARELERVRNELGCALPLVQLVQPTPEYAGLLTADGLARVARYAQGLGPSHAQLARGESGGPRLTPLVRLAHDCGLRLHPYTFRRDELPPYARTLEELLTFFFLEARVDGVFCDHPDIAVRVRDHALEVQQLGTPSTASAVDTPRETA